jgi:hypothetical protein
MLVFDVTSQSSFDNLHNWLSEIYEYCGKGNELFKIVIGNKTDASRVVSRELAEDWAKQHNMEYMEISAKNGEGVSNIFYHTISSVLIVFHLFNHSIFSDMFVYYRYQKILRFHYQPHEKPLIPSHPLPHPNRNPKYRKRK